MKFSIKTAHGFLSIQPSGAIEFRDAVGPWEIFETADLGGPPPAPPAPTNPFHIPPGPLTVDRARGVVERTAAEYESLTAVFSTDEAATDAAVELLLRTIWHLHLAGFEAGRQKNPSGLISADKLTIVLEGGSGWACYDIFTLGFAGQALSVHFDLTSGAQYVPEDGLPD